MSALPEIIVIGDGIGGRALALAWGQCGGDAKIIAPTKTSMIDGGVQLAPNGWDALKILGIEDSAYKVATPLTVMRLLSCATGHSLAQIDLRKRQTYASLDRKSLLKILAEAMPPRVTWQDGTVASLSSHGGKVTLTLTDGTTLTAPYIFAADGAQGMGRTYVMAEESKPNKTRTAFRLTVPLNKLPNYFAAKATSVWLGDGAHLVFYPLYSGMLNIVLVTTAGSSALRQALGLVTSNKLLAPLVPYIEKAKPRPLYSTAPLDVLRRGAVFLCGDAAHPMPPHLAQGAGQSLIDATHLKFAFKNHSDMNAMLTNWAASRLKAVRAIQKNADRAGRLFGLDGPLAKIRNIGLATLGGRAIEKQLDQIWKS